MLIKNCQILSYTALSVCFDGQANEQITPGRWAWPASKNFQAEFYLYTLPESIKNSIDTFG